MPYRKLTIEFLNTVFGSSTEQKDWWRDVLPSHLSQSFNIFTLPFGVADLRWEVLFADNGNPRALLFKRVAKLTGLIFSEEACKKLSGILTSNFKEPLDMPSLIF